MDNAQPLWTPSPVRADSALITRFIAYVAGKYHREFDGYESLYRWSLDEKELFWNALWEFGEVIGEKGGEILLHGDDIEKAVWFPEAKLNFAENLLRTAGDSVAIYFRAEGRVAYQLTWNELRTQVAAVAAWLKSVGVRPGDRVAGYLPNMPEAVVAMLGATSLGAVWTSTSPDFGKESVIERFGQAEPKVLFASDGYFYNGKIHDIRQKVREIEGELESLEQTVTVRLTDLRGDCPGSDWKDILKIDHEGEIDYRKMAFNDPLYILYSSGTTGKPKCITHKVGGVLLQHLKELKLHSDVQSGDKIFYFTTCGWMMWNWLVSGLACGASLVLYDGSPFYPDGNVLWDYAEEVGVTLFGTSAKYIDSLKKGGLRPGNSHNLSALKTLCSTGSVLVPESFDYVYDCIKSDLCLSSISGGTDIVSCFVLGCPILPVYRGEVQCRGLGMAVEVFDEDGRSIVDRKGELVCTLPFPSQPVYFWGDDSGEKYHKAYFARFANVWHHGDYVKLCKNGGVIIYGRSDTTLNPGGVRIGTAEIYRYVEQLEAVLESIAVGQEYDGDLRIVLFVVLREGFTLDEKLKAEIRKTLRSHCSPRHVPAEIIQVTEIPRTKSGKIVELAVREIIHDRPVTNISALANPESLKLFRNLRELQ